MEKIYILGNSETVRHLGYPFVEIPNLTNDYEIHNWLIDLFEKNQMDKLVIEIGNAPILSLKIGLHIRLSIEELGEKSLIPLFFVSTSTLNNIIMESKAWSHIFASKGVYFSSLDNIENIKIELSVIEGISANEYKVGFLDVVKVLDEEKTGRHSLANIWGAYSMDKSANINILNNNIDFQRNKAKLYFKYVSAFKKLNLFSVKIIGRINLEEPKIIDAANKKILLIDDEADKGWETVLRKVFKTSCPEDLVVIQEKVKNYDNLSVESKKLIENTPFDLYLIDLRLNGTEEENTFKSEDFSGMKVMQKIKSLNPGYQVIIFSASNKVWNLKALLDAGADGYYMKESPEFGFSSEFSKQNYLRFQEDVKNCFNRNFLKTLYVSYEEILQKINSFTAYSDNFKEELKNQFQLFWDMILSAKTKTQFAYSYITLYQVIEMINNQFFTKNGDNTWTISGCGNLLDWTWNKETKQYENTNNNFSENKPPESLKFAGLYFQKWNGNEHKFVSSLHYLIQKRNGFIHNDKNILDTQDKNGHYRHHDIYTKDGIIKLFDAVKKIVHFL